MRSRRLLAVTCVLVALGLLLGAERAALAEQPARAPEPASSHQPINRGTESVPNAGHRPPATLSRPARLQPERSGPVRREPVNRGPASRPARGEKVDRAPVSRPSHQRPAEQGAPAGRPTHGRGNSSLHKPTHTTREHPQGRPQEHPRGQKPVGQGGVRPDPPKPVEQPPKSRPEPQRPTPKPLPDPEGKPRGNHQGSEPTGRPEGPPGKENTHTPGSGGVEPPRQSGGPSGHETATDQGTGNEGTTASAPAGGLPPGTETRQHPNRQPASASLAGHESGTRSAGETSGLPENDTSVPLSTSVRREGTVALSGPSSRPPDHQIVQPSRAVETVAVSEGGERRSVGYGARPASVTSYGSTGFFVDYLWGKGSLPVQQAQDGLGSIKDGAHGLAKGTRHGGALTQRAPPLRIPAPFSGYGPVMGGATFGASSSGDGSAPLLAVLVSGLLTFLWRGRSRAYGAFLRPGTVPRLALQRPG